MNKIVRLEVAILMLEQRVEALEESLIKIRQITQETLQDKNLRIVPGPENPDDPFEVIINFEKNERDDKEGR